MPVGIGTAVSPVFMSTVPNSTYPGEPPPEVLLYDTFTVEEEPLDGRTPDIGANDWAALAGGFNVEGGLLYVDGGGGRVATYDLGSAPANLFARCELTVPSASEQFLAIRYGSTDTNIQLLIDTNIMLARLTAQTDAVTFQIDEQADFTETPPEELTFIVEIRAVGTAVTVTVNSGYEIVTLSGTAHASLTANQNIAIYGSVNGPYFDNILVTTP